MLISPAFAQTGDAAGGLMSFLPLILIFVVFYFLLIRPQQKKMKQHKETIANLRRNDKIVTGGGIIGKITKVDEHFVHVELAKGMTVKAVRNTIGEVLSSRSTPAAND